MSEKKDKASYTPYSPTDFDLMQKQAGVDKGGCCGANPNNARSGQAHHTQEQLPQQEGGGGAPGTGAGGDIEQGLELSEEAKNQQDNAARSRSTSGTP